jgi:hypothetical protein
MQGTGWRVRRLDNGAIDYDFYRAEAARQRADAKRSVCAAIGRAVVRQIRRLVASLRASGQARASILRNHPRQ